ncbi:hypothetical protein SLS62_003734 [Diatrype stigma]|uniref:Thioesterase/thiol ester dehydrase-isomerase n=1 Tax=Diatrype stigma TaxID=117547 RepID=A0AAN9YTM3_9PEZI
MPLRPRIKPAASIASSSSSSRSLHFDRLPALRLAAAAAVSTTTTTGRTTPLTAPPRPRPLLSLLRTTAASASAYSNSASEPPPPPPSSRWQSDLVARVGKCIIFGCGPAQVSRAAAVLRAVATEWRALAAGSEGFLTGGRRGMEGQQVVWGEQDSFQHVNNATYIRYAESARVNWITHFAGVDPAHGNEWRELMTPKATGLILKSIKAEYKFPMTYPDRVSVYHKLRSLPEASDTSLILDCVILSHKHRRVAARTEEDIVIYDYKGARKTAMPPFVLDVFLETWRLQEEETRRARGRIWELVKEVETLEKETWNREDAVEDLGAAAGQKS